MVEKKISAQLEMNINGFREGIVANFLQKIQKNKSKISFSSFSVPSFSFSLQSIHINQYSFLSSSS